MIRSPLFFVATTLALATPLLVHAQPVGNLFRGGPSTVYFRAENGKRYSFPNEAVFKSWYPTPPAIEQTGDEDVTRVPFGGIVPLKPGVVLVKVTTDPKVYAVDGGAILRWIRSEDVARTTYGANWAKQVIDLPDELFAAYRRGPDIADSMDYNASQLIAAYSSPNDSIVRIGLPISSSTPTPTPAPTPAPIPAVIYPMSVTTAIGSSIAVVGQTVSVQSTVTGGRQITKLEIRASSIPNPLTTCLNTRTCSANFTVNTAPLSETFYAVATDDQGESVATPLLLRPTLTVLNTSQDVQLSTSGYQISNGSLVTVNSQYTGNAVVENYKLMATLPNNPKAIVWRDCGSSQSCTDSLPVYRNISFYGLVTLQGQQFITSPMQLIQMIGGETPKPHLAVKAGSLQGEYVIDITSPRGEQIANITSLVDGDTLDSTILALCDQPTCSLTVQSLRPNKLRAFQLVGKFYEGSNVIEIKP